MNPTPAAFETPQRLAPGTLLHRLLSSVPAFVLLSFPLFRNPDTAQWISASIAIVAGSITIPWIVLSYLRFRFQITPNEVIIDKGVLTRRHRSIPIERIQNVEIRQTLLQRGMGLSRVRLETAGGAETEGILQFVTPETAEEIRLIIRDHQSRLSPDDAPEPDPESENRTTDAIELPLREILLAGMFRFSLVYIALIFSGLQYLSIQPEDVIAWIMGPRFRSVIESVHVSYAVVFGTSILLAAILAWMAGIFTTLNRFFDYRVWLDSGKLFRRHGLFAVSQGTVPLKRIQMLRIRSNLAMRWMGRARLNLQTMGVDPSQAGSQVALPIGTESLCREFGAQLLTGIPFDQAAEVVSPLHIRRLFIRRFAALSVLIGIGFYWLSPLVLWFFFATPLLYTLSVARYRRHGYGLAPRAITIRSGLFHQETVLIPYERIQVVMTTASIFQRRLGLKTLHIDVAGGERFQSQAIVDLPGTVADNVLTDLYQRFQLSLQASHTQSGSRDFLTGN